MIECSDLYLIPDSTAYGICRATRYINFLSDLDKRYAHKFTCLMKHVRLDPFKERYRNDNGILSIPSYSGSVYANNVGFGALDRLLLFPEPPPSADSADA